MDDTNPSPAAQAKHAEALAEAEAADTGDHPPAFADALNDTDALPSYTPSRNAQPARNGSSSAARYRTDHEYTLTSNKGKAWLLLKLKSRAPSVSNKDGNGASANGSNATVLPLFIDEDEVSGTVEVDLEKPEAWKNLSIILNGDVTAVGQEPVPFVTITVPLWPPSAGPSSSKIQKQTFPFSIKLPKECSLAAIPKGNPGTYSLPPTFSERAGAAYIDYKLTVTVKKGTFKSGNTLGTGFVLLPRIIAPPPSQLRLLSVNEGSPLIGPDGDPEGWDVLPSAKVGGSLFEAKNIEVEFTLALAKPLAYTPNSPLPLQVTITCADDHALDLLATPTALVRSVTLSRVIAIGSEATNDDAPRRSNNTFTIEVGHAVFWPSPEGSQEPGVRKLQGEVEVPRGTKPSFIFPRFSLRYFINFQPPTAAGFTLSSPNDPPIFSTKVSVVTRNAPGFTPRSQVPPGYAAPEGGNYNTSVGYLENGNQRFFHHHPFG